MPFLELLGEEVLLEFVFTWCRNVCNWCWWGRVQSSLSHPSLSRWSLWTCVFICVWRSTCNINSSLHESWSPNNTVVISFPLWFTSKCIKNGHHPQRQVIKKERLFSKLLVTKHRNWLSVRSFHTEKTSSWKNQDWNCISWKLVWWLSYNCRMKLYVAVFITWSL